MLDEEREVDGLGPDELLAIYRSLILLRTYDERSVVYHRQGRIGTYAIFWNHEAMQAGSVHALDDGDWIFPSYRESAGFHHPAGWPRHQCKTVAGGIRRSNPIADSR